MADMNEEKIGSIKKSIMAIGRLLWEKDLASGLNGNISARVDEKHILITATKTCLGLLQAKDILLVDLSDHATEPSDVSTEKLLHQSVYKEFLQTSAIIHTHTTYTNAFFLENTTFHPKIFESKLWFGDVVAIEQRSPSVTDIEPVLKALGDNNIVALRYHGVVAMGKDLFDCFLLVQGLEDAIKVEALSRLYRNAVTGKKDTVSKKQRQAVQSVVGKYNLFSPEHIAEIVRLVNKDGQLKRLGEKTKMTMSLAVKMDETGQIYNFKFVNGAIAEWGQDADAQFLISASEQVWRAVFNRKIDPFVATTQKKMSLRGDFAKISKWYEPCCRIFELWQEVPIQ